MYGDEVEFLVVYLREAHALDSAWPMGGGEHPIVEDPLTLGERIGVARQCLAAMELEGIPAVVDDVDDAVGSAWAGHPDRLYLVGRDGRVAFRGGPGPFGFDPDALEEAILAELLQADG